MEPLSSLQVQYTVPSPSTQEVLYRGCSPSQAYRYSTLSPPPEHSRPCAEDGAPLKAYRYSTLYPPPEHSRPCTEDGALVKLTGTVHCTLPLNTAGPIQRMEPLSSLQVQYTVPSPSTQQVLYRGWNPSQAYRYSTLYPPPEHSRPCAEDGALVKLTGTVHCPPPLNTAGPIQRMEPLSSLQVQYTSHPLNTAGPVQRMEPLSSLQVQYIVPP